LKYRPGDYRDFLKGNSMKICSFRTLAGGHSVANEPTIHERKTQELFERIHGGKPVTDNAYSCPDGFTLWRTSRGETFAIQP
jgi:hypothetical protein